MSEAKFILSKRIVKEQVQKLMDLGLYVSYSYKTNREIGKVLQEFDLGVDFSIHAKEEIEMIKNKSKVWFFLQAESEEELKKILNEEIRSFVIDNEIDLNTLLRVVENMKIKINIGLRMKFKEHRIGSGKYFVYGMSSRKVNELVKELEGNNLVDKIGIHIHRKSQNTSEWEIKSELEDSISEESLKIISFVNLGGGLPSQYRNHALKDLSYVFEKLVDSKKFLDNFQIETVIEPGRFIAAPAIKLETEIIQIQNENIIINTTLYNCALDTLIGGHKMLVEGELKMEEEGMNYLIKGNSPTRDDIFRYRVKLKKLEIGDKIIFLNAGAYNYTTDFFGYKKLKTEVID
jgi:ornithine decarboxylase